LIVLVGPTGVGKTRVAVAVAPQVGGEIVSADSRQIYRWMDIGTAKPTLADQAKVPHHLIDLVDPDQPLTLAEYQTAALHAINAILERGRLPFLVGGTGLYVRAVVEGLVIPAVPPDLAFRQEMMTLVQTRGPGWLYEELKRLDPVAAMRIEPENVRRVIRALEVIRATGRPFSSHQPAQPPAYAVTMIGLTLPRPALYARIDARVDQMIADGLVEEVKSLLERGYSFDLPAMTGLGYRQIGEYLRGKITLAAAIQEIKFRTHAFVRHQYNWFRLSDPRITWIEADDQAVAKVLSIVSDRSAEPATRLR